jgi:peroxiredoxin Q/BCP
MSKLKSGDKAPDFKGINQNGETVSLADYAGKKLVMYFYPKDLTPGCTNQACNLRDNYESLLAKGFEVLGVSADSEARHQKFIDKYELPFSLLADTEHEVIKSFGVWGPKKFMGKEYEGINRTTFVIDEEGTIEHVIDKVKTKNHTEQVLELFA